MALVASQSPTITGTTPTYGAVTASDTYAFTTDACFLIVKNASASPCTATVVVPGTTYGQANPDVPVTVPITTGERWIGPFKADLDDDTVAGQFVTVTYSPITSVTAAYVTL